MGEFITWVKLHQQKWGRLDGFVIQFGLETFVFRDLSNGLHKVLIHDVLPFGPDGEKTGLCANVPQIGSVESIGQLDHGFVVDLAVLGDWPRMDLENFQPRLVVWQWDLNFPVQPSWSQQGRVKGVGSVGGHDHFDLAKDVKSVHLVEELHQSSLDLSVSGSTFREPSATDGINFVHEN